MIVSLGPPFAIGTPGTNRARMQNFVNFLSPLPTIWKNYNAKVFDGLNIALSNLVFRICVSFMVVKI